MTGSSRSRQLAIEEERYYWLLRKVFYVWASFYDVAFRLLSFGAIARLRENVVDIADLRKSSTILDIGTGTGGQAFAFARRGFDVVGIDLSEHMLEVAKKKNEYENATFEIADAAKLPFKDQSFDGSCVSFALHDMIPSIRERAVKEMARVTKTRGTIIIVDYGLPKNKVRRFFIYNFVRLYEVYYSEFIRFDLGLLLRKSGIEIKEKWTVLFGAGRILKGTKIAKQRPKRN